MMTHTEHIFREQQLIAQESHNSSTKVEHILHQRGNLVRHLNKATPYDYLTYLKMLKAQGIECTHFYNYDLNIDSDLYITRNSTPKELLVPKLTGAFSVNIIVLPGIDIVSQCLGHNTIFYMDVAKYKPSWIPSYNNANMELI